MNKYRSYHFTQLFCQLYVLFCNVWSDAFLWHTGTSRGHRLKVVFLPDLFWHVTHFDTCESRGHCCQQACQLFHRLQMPGRLCTHPNELFLCGTSDLVFCRILRHTNCRRMTRTFWCDVVNLLCCWNLWNRCRSQNVFAFRERSIHVGASGWENQIWVCRIHKKIFWHLLPWFRPDFLRQVSD